MGGKDSKPCCITYDEALKRVSEAESRRLRDAFKRTSTLNGLMTKQSFIREVLGDGIPSKLAEHIYYACGGSAKGIGFKDLVCGLVLLTRGHRDEKIKFIFGLYANESGSHVAKDEMVHLVQACEGGYIPEAVANCFLESEKVTFEEFGAWLRDNPEATSLTRWLLTKPCSVSLSNDLETPTFYQTLAGVTHLEEVDIIELEKRYWMLKAYSRTGKFDLETFTPLVCPPVPTGVCEGFFNAFDENRDDHIDFKEIACGISACCRGPIAERQKFCFKVFDTDRDGALSPDELRMMAEALILVESEHRRPLLDSDEGISTMNRTYDVESVLEEILTYFDANKDGAITLDEYLVWSVGHPLALEFINLLFQVCHIVLGLRPATKEEEGSVVRDWLDREEGRGLQIGHVWYLVSMDWWRAWHEYINYQPSVNSFNGSGSSTCSSNSSGSFTDSLKRNKIMKKMTTFEVSSIESDVTTSNGFVNVGNDGGDGTLRRNVYNNAVNSIRSSSASSTPNASPRITRKTLASQSQSSFYNGMQRPGAIDNSLLVVPNTQKVMMLTREGGKLKKNVIMTRGRDFELIPEPVWKALWQWYGGSPALPRQVILAPDNRAPELELYPICLRFLRHQIANVRPATNSWSGVVGGYGAPAYGYPSTTPAVPRRYLAYMASFSRLSSLKQVFEFLCSRLKLRPEDMRLWHFTDENNMSLLEDENCTLAGLEIEDNDQILIEVRNKDQTWPEEMSSLANRNNRLDRRKQVMTEKGATGLNNLGNTCFMNAALQCVSNTRPLTMYFTRNMHLYELNRNNPLGMKGIIAKRYGDLVHDLWSGASKTIAPLKLRWTIGKYAPRFNGFQQHDSQELLAFLLDGLHEDLNRVHDKPYVELTDSDGRSDVIVAQEVKNDLLFKRCFKSQDARELHVPAWENHILRNKSIIVDLFHGQLKSCVRCKVCGHESVRFDPFNYLSLPLPMESCVHLEVIVIRLDGRIPMKYGLRLDADEKYTAIKLQLSELCGIPANHLMLAEVFSSMIKCVPANTQRIRTNMTGTLFAYEIPSFHDSIIIGEEDSKLKVNSEPQTLTQIQRMDRGGMVARLSNRSFVSIESPANDLRSVGGNDSPERLAFDEGVGSEDSSQATDDSGNSNLPEVHMSFSKHNRNPSNLSTSSTASSIMSSSLMSTASHGDLVELMTGFVVAFHRKMIRQDVYFLSSQKTRPSVFGLPLVLPCQEATTHLDLYQATWIQVAHLVSPLPPSDSNVPNHAHDCDDSLGYEFPFILKAVQRDGLVCAWCPWYRFCRGCKIECNDSSFNFASSYIAIDWDPTALHLRYQASQERVTIDHESVERARKQQSDPIDLDTCLNAFTKEEELGDDEKYYCSKCKQHQLASKKLQIWRLPPILIVHLKRFQFVNGHWVKSQKIVKFHYEDFDPTNYLAAIPRLAVHGRRKKEETEVDIPPTPLLDDRTSSGRGSPSQSLSSEGTTTIESPTVDGFSIAASLPSIPVDLDVPIVNGGSDWDRESVHGSVTPTNLVPPVAFSDGTSFVNVLSSMHKCRRRSVGANHVPQEFHQHRLQEGFDPFDLKYNLYAISCHSGILGGGHYVCYACNPNNRWYCYNDSSCKEVNADQIDSNSAYMLFYERNGIDYEQYMPSVSGKLPEVQDIEDDIESDFRKLCCLQ